MSIETEVTAPPAVDRDAVLDMAERALAQNKKGLHELLLGVAGMLDPSGYAVDLPIGQGEWGRFLFSDGAYGRGLKLLRKRGGAN